MNPENDEDFGALLAEYENEVPVPQRSDLPQVGDKVRGRIVTVGRDAVFVALGGKAEAVLDIEQVTGSDGAVMVAAGDEIEARVVEIRAGQVVLRTSMGRGPDARAELNQAFQHGLPVEGQVTAVNKGGVEVQISAMRAFCPISQLDLRFVEDAASYVGQKLTFRIIRFETGRGGNPNIVLSRRVILEEEARERAEETRAKLTVGAVMQGVVTSIKGYGAFVDLGGVEGMIHISELGFSRVEHPGDMLSVGQSLEVQVIRIEKTNNPKRPEKIALSLKALASDPWDQLRPSLQEGTRVRGKVVRTQPFGAFVELAPGVEGLVHVSELGADRRVSHPKEVVDIGDEVHVTVLSVDDERRRISLSMAATRASEEAEQVAKYKPPSKGASLGTFADLLKKK
ncbi:MAG: S1 RNA-binding domain-containing protein [Proteobacteria bacterium]|nr:S1 RNA-binding domain-containing protein [Pseudomonadota bacterium]